MTTEPQTFRAAGRLIDFMRQADEPGLINLAAGVPGLEALPVEELRAAARAERIVFASGAVFFTQPPEKTCLRLNCAKATEAELVHGLITLGAILSAV